MLEIEGQEAVVYPPPNLTPSTAHDFKRSIRLAHNLNPDRVVVDFSPVTFCDGIALSVLAEAVDAGYRIQIRNVASTVREAAAEAGIRLPEQRPET